MVISFNPSTKEVEMGSDMAGQREECQERRREDLNLRIVDIGYPIQFEEVIEVRILVIDCSAFLIF